MQYQTSYNRVIGGLYQGGTRGQVMHGDPTMTHLHEAAVASRQGSAASVRSCRLFTAYMYPKVLHGGTM